MRQRRLVSLCLAAGLIAGLACAERVAAAGFGLFQHGGRGLGQAGALTARAPEPTALTYNPAGIVHLDGLQVQAGLDFSNTVDQYSSSTGSFSAKHIIDFPPALYMTYKPQGRPWAFGIGLDAPFWYRIDWLPALFPGRFLNDEQEVRVFELHPVLAYDLGDGWSVGGGLRYLYGNLAQGNSVLLTVPGSGSPQPPVNVEVERRADTGSADAFSWDVSVQYADPSWGWGAVYRGNAELKGSGDATYRARPTGNPAADAQAQALLHDGNSGQAFEIPRELRGGVWFAPYPELRVEADASWQSWSSLENTSVTWGSDPLRGGGETTVLTRRDWEDTLSLRLGVEGNLTDPLLVYGGVAWEPSPVPGSTAEPGFPRGDALVYGFGASYSLAAISFDLGYSYHDHDKRTVSGQEPRNPAVNGSYEDHAQVWGFSVRWRW
jgi:long-chain fatty acid transport protein